MKITTPLFGDLALNPYQPRKPIKEKLEWLTDVFVSYNGTETRKQKRSLPRQTFEYEIPLVFWKRIEALNTLKGGVRDLWAIPIWTEAQSVGNIGVQTVVNCDTEVNYFYKEDTLVFLYGSEQEFQFGEIEALNATSVALYAQTTALDDAYIMPLKRGWIMGDVEHKTNGLESFVKIKFLIQDYTDITESIPGQFEGSDIYDFKTITNGKSNRIISQKQDVIDFDLGLVDSRSRFLNSHYGESLGFIPQGPSEIQTFKQFLYRCAGKSRNFWLPTFENDVNHVSTGTITTTLLFLRNAVEDYMLNRRYISILTKDGVSHPVEIQSLTIVDTERAQFNFTSTVGVEAEDIVLISYLSYNRLNTDSVNLQWIGNNTVRSNVNTIESNLYNVPMVIT